MARDLVRPPPPIAQKLNVSFPKERPTRLRQRQGRIGQQHSDDKWVRFEMKPTEAVQIRAILDDAEQWHNLHNSNTMVVRQLLGDLLQAFETQHGEVA